MFDKAIKIREIEDVDLPEIGNLISDSLRSCVTNDETIHGNLLSEILNGFDWWHSNKEKCFGRVAVQEEKILGVILVKEFWNFSDLFVLPEAQRKGIGKTLVKLALDECRTKSPTKKMVLNSSTFAKSFYSQMGFKSSGDSRDLPGGCHPFEFNFSNEIQLDTNISSGFC